MTSTPTDTHSSMLSVADLNTDGRPLPGPGTTSRAVMYFLLLVVAAAAAVLSFAALRDLALTCGFAPSLAWLLPVVVDAGAAAGSLVWLGGWSAEAARRFARALALALLGLSVAANALGHGLAAFDLRPAWWVVVAVSAIAPAVLGAVVHLAVLVGRPDYELSAVRPSVRVDNDAERNAAIAAAAEAGDLDERGLSRRWEHAPAEDADRDRAALLIAAGAGRRRLSRELAISEYEARQLLERTRTSRPDSTVEPADSTSSPGFDVRGEEAAADRPYAVNGTGGPR